ncbi:hypothetical protein ACFSQP_03115 [Bizionia sediminis]|uniref:Uncharacterized protein n=1 Tax=Bizionia sediminis TaxID=1737064 RepID=A0ABW5KPW5_9FLAO
MKKQVHLFTALLIGLATVTAKNEPVLTLANNAKTAESFYAQPIIFMERGIEFMVFPDGSFDFNTHSINQLGHVNSGYYYRKPAPVRRHLTNNTYGAPIPRRPITYAPHPNHGVVITHSPNGQIRRIGNVYINYTRLGKVKRVGTVYMQYNRNGMLRQIGGLHVHYNYWGQLVSTHGMVKPFNRNCTFCGIVGCRTNHHPKTYMPHEQAYTQENDFYYYKHSGSKKDTPKLERPKLKHGR